MCRDDSSRRLEPDRTSQWMRSCETCGGGALWAGLIVALAGLVGIAVAQATALPRDPLHIVYGILAVGRRAGTAIAAGGRVGRGRAVAWAFGGIVLLILVMRPFQTGG